MVEQTDTRADVSEIIEELLSLTEWSEHVLAMKVGTSQPTLHRWKTGKTSASVAYRNVLLALLHEHRREVGLDPSGQRDTHVDREKLRAIILRTIRIFPAPEGPPTKRTLRKWQNLLANQTELIEEEVFGEQAEEMSVTDRIKALEMAVDIITEELEKHRKA